MLATLKKAWPLTVPRSILRVLPATITSAACGEIHRNAERARKIVGGAERNDAERQPAFDDGHGAGRDGAVAAAKNDEIGAFAQPDDVAGDLGQGVERLDRDVDAAPVQPSDDRVDGLAAAAGFRVDEQQRSFLDLFQGSPVPS